VYLPRGSPEESFVEDLEQEERRTADSAIRSTATASADSDVEPGAVQDDLYAEYAWVKRYQVHIHEAKLKRTTVLEHWAQLCLLHFVFIHILIDSA
jgi:hypothetical protein